MKIVRIMKYWLMSVLLGVLACSCHRDPLMEEDNRYFLDLHLDMNILHKIPPRPEIFIAAFYDPSTGELIDEQYMTPSGDAITCVGPGIYDIIVYSYGSRTTLLKNTRRFEDMTAYTNLMKKGSSGHESVYYAPDHIWADALTNVKFPFLTEYDDAYTVNMYPKSLAESWCLVVEGIKGLANAENIEITVSGQSKSKTVHNRDLNDDSVTVFFKGTLDAGKDRIYTIFQIFGKHPDENSQLQVNLNIAGPDNTEYVINADVTDQFLDPGNTGHWIFVKSDIVIGPKRDGGFAPYVDNWDGEYEHLNVM